jgi:hypothetical protein
VILRSNSEGDLYPLHSATPASNHCLAAVSADLWHQRLGHPGNESFCRLLQSFDFNCNKEPSHTCHACHTGKHVCLPFHSSTHQTTVPFELIHYDVWTSPVLSFTRFQYYLVLLDDFTHFVWTFPCTTNLRLPNISCLFMLMLVRSSIAPFALSKQTMDASLTTLSFVDSTPRTAFCSGSHAPTLLSKAAKPNGSYAL